jgi:hypothetical protein
MRVGDDVYRDMVAGEKRREVLAGGAAWRRNERGRGAAWRRDRGGRPAVVWEWQWRGARAGEGTWGLVRCGMHPWAGPERKGERAQEEKKNGPNLGNSAISYEIKIFN